MLFLLEKFSLYPTSQIWPLISIDSLLISIIRDHMQKLGWKFPKLSEIWNFEKVLRLNPKKCWSHKSLAICPKNNTFGLIFLMKGFWNQVKQPWVGWWFGWKWCSLYRQSCIIMYLRGKDIDQTISIYFWTPCLAAWAIMLWL